MSGRAPFFIGGHNAKIVVNGVTLAFVTDFRYSVKIKHAEAKILGVYEHDTAEPLSYDVSGSFTLIRYVEGLKNRYKDIRIQTPNGVSNLGNGVGSWTKNQPKFIEGTVSNSGNFTNDGRANEALDPGKLHTGTWFNIEFYQRAAGGQTGVVRIRNCRITSADASVSKRSVMQQTFQFIANSVDEDSFLSTQSGVGQTTA